MIKTEKTEDIELNKGITDLVTHDQLLERLNSVSRRRTIEYRK